MIGMQPNHAISQLLELLACQAWRAFFTSGGNLSYESGGASNGSLHRLQSVFPVFSRLLGLVSCALVCFALDRPVRDVGLTYRSRAMDIYPSDSIFSELKSVHDTGYYDAQLSLEDRWQQVPYLEILVLYSSCVS